MRGPGAGSRIVRGATLVELTVALAIMGTTLAVVGLGMRGMRPAPEARVMAEIALARQQAVLSGRTTTVALGGRAVRFAPDGSATGGPLVTDSLVFHVDPLTGAIRVVPR